MTTKIIDPSEIALNIGNLMTNDQSEFCELHVAWVWAESKEINELTQLLTDCRDLQHWSDDVNKLKAIDMSPDEIWAKPVPVIEHIAQLMIKDNNDKAQIFKSYRWAQISNNKAFVELIDNCNVLRDWYIERQRDKELRSKLLEPISA